jgi:hypothetical protein
MCSPRYRGSKRITIDFYRIRNTSEGQISILAKGMDGIMYSLVVNDQPSIPIPFSPPTSEHLKADTDKANKTWLKVLLH